MKIILSIAMILFVSYTSALAAREKCGTQANGQDVIKGSNVTSFPVDYDVEKNNWNLTALDVDCANVDGDKPFEWRSKYGWAAFCGPVGPTGEEACGKCLTVTNRRTNALVKARIVDTCGTGGVDLDEPVFKELDTDGHGNFVGHLMVDYEFVDCDDHEVNGKFNFKNILASAIDRV